MKLICRILKWLFADGELKDEDFERVLFCTAFILFGLFIATVSTVVVSCLCSVLTPTSQ